MLGQLYSSNLLYAELPPDAASLFNRYTKRVRRQVQGFGAGARDESEIPGYDFSMGNTTLSKENVGAARAKRKKEVLARKKARQQAREEREIEEQIDSLLDKISESGMDSLTRQERAFLEKASRRKK